jgi:hypothetical protein
MRLVLWLLIGLLIAGCGRHSQTLIRRGVQESVLEVGETDQALQMINAVNAGALEQVRELVAAGADLNGRSNEGLTLIMIAIRAQQFAVIEFLVTAGADLELKTSHSDIDPSLNARKYVTLLAMGQEVETIVMGILDQEPFAVETLNDFVYTAITFQNIGLLDWLLQKGVSPNVIRTSESGRPKDSPLIYLFSLRGVDDEDLPSIQAIFDLLVSHPEIDVNLKVRRDTPLSKAQRALSRNPGYQAMVDQLKAMGATD